MRVGNAAADQFQLDVFGELLDAAYRGRELTGSLGPERLGAPAAPCSSYLEEIWREPDEGIWEVRGPAPPVHPLQGDGLGRLRPRDQDRARSRAARATSSAGGGSARRSTTRSRRGLRPRAQHLHPVLRLRGARRGDAADPGRRLPAARRRARDRHDRRDPDASWPATGSSGATRPARARTTSTACAARRARSCPARSGSPTPWRWRGAPTRRASCSSGCWACSTTSA